MSGKIIFLIVKTILRIVGLETGFPARAQKKMFVGKSDNLPVNGLLKTHVCAWKTQTFVYIQRSCLEDTTERSDSNRVRSARMVNARMRCLEGTTPVAMLIVQVLWRSAFQAHRALRAYPGTSYPVTIATLCSAFQALNA